MRNSCCKDCTDRTVDCHSICEKYLKESEEAQKLREERYNRLLSRYDSRTNGTYYSYRK